MVNSVLLIKSEYLNQILNGLKTIEIRSCSCKSKINETIGIAYCGKNYRNKSKQIVATVKIVDCKLYNNRFDYLNDIKKHLYIGDDINLPYKNTYGWVFDDLKILDIPVVFEHKKGAIVWCKC